MDAAGRRRMYGLAAVYDYVIAAICAVAFVVALVVGVGAESVLFLLAALGWLAAGRWFARRSQA